MEVEFMLKGSKIKIDTDTIISMLKAGNDIENEYIIGVIQELIAKCKAVEPLNISILDLLSITEKQFKDIKRLEAELKQLKEENEKAKSNTHGINWELFATGEIAVQCETESDVEAFIKEVIKRGYRCFHTRQTWRDYRENTCFRNEYIPHVGTFVLYSNKSYCKDKGIKVVKWEPDEKEALYDALESVQEEAGERINKLVKYCRNLRKENESLKNDKAELLLAIENTRHDLEKAVDYQNAIIDGFSGSDKFDWERFKTGNVAVHCKTKKEAEDFINKSKQYIKTWRDGDKIDEERTYWVTHENEMCYVYNNIACYAYYGYNNIGLMISSREISHNCGREILEWSDYMVKHDE